MKSEAALETGHGRLQLPAFLPDGTRGVVRTLDARDLEACGMGGVMVNTLHLSSRPGTTLIGALGGIHRFMGWNRPVASDSGGFQVFSLVVESPGAGQVSRKGFSYRLGKGHKRQVLTPEKCIQKQFQVRADVMFCLDHCTHPEADRTAQQESVDHTVDWARRCKAAFETRREQTGSRPLLFGVVQGGEDRDLRQRCAEELLAIGFDGYGYGGWPIDSDGGLVDAVGWVRELIPDAFPLHGLGIGKPENLLAAFNLGYDTFDCTLPTRDARQKRLYVFTEPPAGVTASSTSFYRYLYIEDERFARDSEPVDETCDCLCCGRYSRGYLHHLFRVNDALALRLATMHNLRFYSRLVGQLKGQKAEV